MKTLTTPQTVVITYTRRGQSTGGKHDPWPDHSNGGVSFDVFQCVSGAYVLVFDTTLKTGVQMSYIIGGLTDSAGVDALNNAYVNYTTAAGITGARGEWWNFVGRSMVSTGMRAQDLGLWLISH